MHAQEYEPSSNANAAKSDRQCILLYLLLLWRLHFVRGDQRRSARPPGLPQREQLDYNCDSKRAQSSQKRVNACRQPDLGILTFK